LLDDLMQQQQQQQQQSDLKVALQQLYAEARILPG
jgi:hypothetical protein